MAKTTYMLGAGINMSVRNADGGSHPPLATDFFRQLHRSFREDRRHFHADNLLVIRDVHREVYDYIKRYWKLSFEDLSAVPFDLEACFTLLEQQKAEANATGNVGDIADLWRVENQLIGLFGSFLTLFRVPGPGTNEYQDPALHPFVVLGSRILDEQASVLTFNYDTLLEDAMAFASGPRKVSAEPESRRSIESKIEPEQKSNITYDQLSHSPYNWNPLLAHGFRFDEVQPVNDPEVSSVSGDRFYSHDGNKPYSSPFLKLHGSLTWFSYTGSGLNSDGRAMTDDDKKGKTIYFPDAYRWVGARHSNNFLRHGDWIVTPLIITPVLNKGVAKPPFGTLWRLAREQLRSSQRLVVGGYSFPPTDFATRRMFLEAFSDHALDELVIINPDTSVVELVKELCHFTKPVWVCKNLEEYLAA